MKEKALIARIRRMSQRQSPAIVEGIGDDCAILGPRPGHDLLVTTDFSLEGVHFRRDWSPARDIGHRCLARGLSDIAAMGGTPLAAFLSLAVPARLPQAWADDFLKGLLGLAEKHKVTLAGGDLAQSPQGVLTDIMVVGEAPAGRALRRSGARPGDLIYVTGNLGLTAAAIASLRAGERAPIPLPEPRLRVAAELSRQRLATAAIDISDGLSTDLAHICEESGEGAEVVAEAIPAPAGIDFALHGGDDYELLFTARPRTRIPRRIAGVPVHRIGRITSGRAMTLVAGRKRLRLQPAGWQHFQDL